MQEETFAGLVSYTLQRSWQKEHKIRTLGLMLLGKRTENSLRHGYL